MSTKAAKKFTADLTSQEKIHKLLYIPAFFALIQFIVFAMQVQFFLFISGADPHMIVNLAINVLFLLSMMAMPFIKQNQLLFLILINTVIALPRAVAEFVSLFSNISISIQIAGVPPIIGNGSALLLNVSGLILLALRLYGYNNERKMGRYTEF